MHSYGHKTQYQVVCNLWSQQAHLASIIRSARLRLCRVSESSTVSVMLTVTNA